MFFVKFYKYKNFKYFFGQQFAIFSNKKQYKKIKIIKNSYQI